MRNAIIYARFSPRRFADKSLSCEKQIKHCSAYIALHEIKQIESYRDNEISGKDILSRPGLQQALEHVCQIKGVLVCFSLSRLARNVRDCLAIAEKLKKSGADLVLLDISMDTSTPVGNLFFTIMAALDQFERERIGERTSVGMKYLQSQGRKISSKPPFGYIIDPDDSSRIIPHQQEQEAVKKILELNNSGTPLREIARTPEKNSHKCRGKNWHHSTISRIIQREI